MVALHTDIDLFLVKYTAYKPKKPKWAVNKAIEKVKSPIPTGHLQIKPILSYDDYFING